MKRFWLSWYTALEDSPETPWPWWVSGEAYTDPTLWTICALIDAGSEADAKAYVLEAFPDAAQLPFNWTAAGSRSGWRFCEEVAVDWTPEPSRFPLPVRP